MSRFSRNVMPMLLDGVRDGEVSLTDILVRYLRESGVEHDDLEAIVAWARKQQPKSSGSTSQN